MTRFEDTEPEEKMAKLDVFFIEEGGSVFYHETIDRASNPVYKQGEFTLNKKRSDFAVNVKYYVYIVANATADLAKVGTKADLMALVQEDENLYLSGFGVEGAPDIFLMDGYADVKENDSKVPVAVTVNDGTNGKTSLTGILRRAAAKVIINITQGDNVQFKQRIPDEGNLQGEALYSIYQLPVSTLVLTPDGSSWHNSKKVTTPDQRINNTTFTWTEGNDGKPQIRIIAYAYANDWSDTEITKETSMILNLPMLWDHDNDKTNDPESRPNSWFKIPLSRENKFERNTCYQINIKINAVGAQDKSSVIELQDIEYVTREWITQRVEVGQNESKPQYLMLNTDLVEIYNENVDVTSLTFSSSSYIKSITLKDVYKQNSDGSFTKESDSHKAYYINKFGVTTELGSNIVSTISAVAEQNKLNGGITITSPINGSDESEDTHYNTIRYLEFEVENMTGQKATFRVMQYPVIYITNQQCWFSYRDDFGGTTYLNRGTKRVTCATFNNQWGYSTKYNESNHFFASKVVSSFNESNGQSVLSYYQWDKNNKLGTPANSGNSNAHYYHVHVTSTSNKYTVAIPQKDPTTGYVKNTVDNEKLVSPSFMIASQLGAVWSGRTGYDRNDAAYHCSQYVEVYKLAAYEEGALTATINGATVYYKELRGWRLPTAAEIDIIVQHQTGAAMDVVLGGKFYYCAGKTTHVNTGQKDDTETIYTRCIRDAY